METVQQDVLAQAVNEALEELYRSLRVPLSGTRGDAPVDGALTDVIDQLLGSRGSALDLASAPPPDSQLPDAADG